MVHFYESLNSAFSLCLTVFSVTEFVILSAAVWYIKILLDFTTTLSVSFIGIVAALISFITSFIESSEGHCCSRFCWKKRKCFLFIALFVTTFQVIMILSSIITVKSFAVEFHHLMVKYRSPGTSQPLCNDMQDTFQCCGAKNYEDWFQVNWKGYEISDDEDYEEEVDTASVPYSCCRRSSSVPCGHYDLKTLGTASINHRGCAPLIKSYTLTYLWFLLILFFSNLILEILLLALYHNESKRVVVTNCDTHGSNKIEDTDITCMQYQKLSPTWESEMGCNPLMLYDDHSERKSLQEIDEIESGKNRRSRSRSPSNSKSESKTKSSSLFPSSFNSRKSTPVLTSSHKQIRILSPLQDVGNSPFVSKVRIFPRHK